MRRREVKRGNPSQGTAKNDKAPTTVVPNGDGPGLTGLKLSSIKDHLHDLRIPLFRHKNETTCVCFIPAKKTSLNYGSLCLAMMRKFSHSRRRSTKPKMH